MTMRPMGIPLERMLCPLPAAATRACKHREIAKPPGRDAGVGEKAEEKTVPNATPRPIAPMHAAMSAAQ